MDALVKYYQAEKKKKKKQALNNYLVTLKPKSTLYEADCKKYNTS